MNDPKKPTKPVTPDGGSGDVNKDGKVDGADHVETFREGEVETPVDAPPPPERPTPRR